MDVTCDTVPRRVLRVAIIGGAGNMGKAHSLAFSLAPLSGDLGVDLRRQVLVETDAGLATSAAARLGWSESATDWRAVVARPDIDIVDIVTPPHLHAPIALAAIANGKHVYCEKPVTNDSAEALKMAQLAREAGVVGQVGFNYRGASAIRFAKQLLNEGRLGHPLQFRAVYQQETGFYSAPGAWRGRRETGGSGAASGIGSHIIDVAEYLNGPIERVTARLRTRDVNAGWVSETARIDGDMLDSAGIWLAEFANGVIGTFSCSYFSSGSKNRFAFELDGTLGAIQFDWNLRDQLRVASVDEPAEERGVRTIHMSDVHPDGWWRLAGTGSGYVDAMAVQLQHFVRDILDGGGGQPSFAEAAHVQQVVEAISRSAQTGIWVEVPTPV